jgi:hypothetical protein
MRRTRQAVPPGPGGPGCASRGKWRAAGVAAAAWSGRAVVARAQARLDNLVHQQAALCRPWRERQVLRTPLP